MILNPRKTDYRGNIISQITLFWLEKLLIRCFNRNITQDDLNPCPKEQCSTLLFEKFNKHWQVELKKDNPDIKISLFKSLYPIFIVGGIFYLFEMLLFLIQGILLRNFISLCTGGSVNQTDGQWRGSLGYAFVISLSSIVLTLIHCISFYLLNCVGIQMRAICVTAFFKKILRIQQSVLHKISIGHVINLVSNDVYKFDVGMVFMNAFWVSPVLLVIQISIILFFIGPVGLLGVFYFVLNTPIQVLFGYIFGHFRYNTSITADKRIRLMDQIIRGIRVIKFYVWEIPFVRYVSRIRRKEIFYANIAGILQSTTYSMFTTSIYIALFITYTVSIALKQPISSQNLALAFVTYNSIRLNSVLLLGSAVFAYRECVFALRRIQKVMQLPENIQSCLVSHPSSPTSLPSLKFINFSSSWKGTEIEHFDSLVIKNINLDLGSPQLVSIAGPIGAGKSSLVMSIINELPGISGQLNITGRLSYTAQVPWIFSGTIRDNILFGNTPDSNRYQEVISACSLREDIDSYEAADMTMIGEKGVTLSGGQKARISLARSIYHTADIYLLDDPLSAVDVRVGKEIFEKCIRGLLREKLVLMVTHQLNYVKQCDHVIIMKEGIIIANGTYSGVVEENEFCREFLQSLGKDETNKPNKVIELNDSIALKLEEAISPLTILPIKEDTVTQPLSTAMTSEDYRPDSTSLVAYLRYFWEGGVLATLLVIVLSILGNGGLLLAYWWMQYITDCTSVLTTNQSIGMYNTTNQSIGMYSRMNNTSCPPWYYNYNNPGSIRLLALLTFLSSLFVVIRGFNFYYVVLQASRRLHNKMLKRLVHTPVHFFDTNPSGRILNRFSKDIGFMDEQLPFAFYGFWQHLSNMIAIIIATSIEQVFLLIPFAILLVSMLILRFYYLRTSSQVKRLESLARSPLYSHISLTLQGLSTVRALGIEERITQDLHLLQDRHAKSWFHYMCLQRWFGLRLDLMSAFVVIFAVFYAFFSRCIFSSSELIGFSLPLLLTLALSFQYMVRQSGEVEIFMVSVDRVLKYCRLPQEPVYTAAQHDSTFVSGKDKGVIEFRNVHFRYSDDLPYTLQDVSLSIRSGEKIGIVGRTGAGKSSLFNSLLRISALSSGSIRIDSRDIAGLNLYQHRKRISVIPQDPFLFSGTLKYNLDPFGEFSEEKIWSALDKAFMKTMVESLSNQLLANVEEDGLDFSTGERQLLCLARAILRQNKIILIDEATANVDMHTDVLVQRAIRTHFSDCSVLTVAHRIETIIDSDRIIVVEKGSIVESDVPYILLQKEGSYLNKLVGQLEASTQSSLRDVAEKSYRCISLHT